MRHRSLSDCCGAARSRRNAKAPAAPRVDSWRVPRERGRAAAEGDRDPGQAARSPYAGPDAELAAALEWRAPAPRAEWPDQRPVVACLPVVQAGSIAEPRNVLCCSHTCTFTRCRDVVDTSPGVRWGDVAGLDEAKRVLRENVVLPLLLPDLFHGIRRPIKARLPGCPSEACRPDARPEPCSAVQGLLMFGPPGTGARGRQAALAAPCGHALRSQRARAHACARAAGQARPCSQRRSRPSATPPSSMSAHPRWHPSTGAPRRSPRHALLCDLMRCDGSAHNV